MGNRTATVRLKRDAEWDGIVDAGTWPYAPLVRMLKDGTDALFSRGYVIRGDVKLLGKWRRRALGLAERMVSHSGRSDASPEAVLSATELQRLVYKMRFTTTFNDGEAYLRVRGLLDELVLALKNPRMDLGSPASSPSAGQADDASASEDIAPGPE